MTQKPIKTTGCLTYSIHSHLITTKGLRGISKLSDCRFRKLDLDTTTGMLYNIPFSTKSTGCLPDVR